MERTTIQPTPPGPDLAVEAAIAERAAQNPQPTAAPTGEEATRATLDVGTAPPRIPEKFKSVNDLVAAYEALERKQSAQTMPGGTIPSDLAAPPQTAEELAEAGKKPPTSGDTPEQQWAAQVSAALERMTEGWAQTGTISVEDSKTLESFGINTAYQQEYLAGSQARRVQRAEKIYELSGGKEQYQELANWANANLSQEAKVLFNESIEHPNEEVVKMALDSVKTRAAEGSGQMQGSFVGGGIQKAPFRSQAEWLAEVATPEYAKDPAVQAEVASRLHRAKQAGIF